MIVGQAFPKANFTLVIFSIFSGEAKVIPSPKSMALSMDCKTGMGEHALRLKLGLVII